MELSSLVGALIGGGIVIAIQSYVFAAKWGKLTQRVQNGETKASENKVDSISAMERESKERRDDMTKMTTDGHAVLESCRKEFQDTRQIIGELSGQLKILIKMVEKNDSSR